MTDPVLTSDGAAWVAEVDAAVVAEHRAEIESGPSYLRDVMDEDDLIDPAESWEAPYGPAIPPGTPVILVDVDGPLSPFTNPVDGQVWPTWVDASTDVPVSSAPDAATRKVDLPLSPDMGAALADLAATTGAQLVFLTTWNEQANESVAPVLGWPSLPVLNMQAGKTFSSERDGWAKLHVLKRWLRTFGPRPLVWFDDDYRLEQYAADDPYVTALPHRLLIRVDREVGLTPEHVAQMRAFLATSTA